MEQQGIGAGRMMSGMKTSVLLWIMALVICAGLFSANIFLGGLNQDEGWYLYASRLVSEGKAPYIDFASTQGPVMP